MSRSSPTGIARSPLARFIVTVLAWLPVTFAVWYVVAPVLIFVVKFLCMLAVLPLGDLVSEVEQNGASLLFVTTLRGGQAAQAGGVVSVSVNGLLYSFGMPMFAALTLAAR